MPANHTEIEKKLWASADELRANSHLKSSEYSVPVLGLIFLRFADHRFGHVECELTTTVHVGSRRTIGKTDYQARGLMYLPPYGASMLMTHVYLSKANTKARCMKMSTIMWSSRVWLRGDLEHQSSVLSRSRG
jgi:hypothetical protein